MYLKVVESLCTRAPCGTGVIATLKTGVSRVLCVICDPLAMSGLYLSSLAWAEIISKKKNGEKWDFYVHYVNCKYVCDVIIL